MSEKRKPKERVYGHGDQIMCPWCDGLHTDLWDIGDGDEGDHEVECHHGCGGVFMLERRASVDYYATPVEPEEED